MPRRSRRAELEAWASAGRPARIGEAEWADLRAMLAPISEHYLRKLLRESGLPLSVMVEGVRQEDLESLDRTLAGLSAEYGKAAAAADRERMRACRRAVITAKDHARLVQRRQPAARDAKQEMILRMMTWLDNPPLFPAWLRLRNAANANPA